MAKHAAASVTWRRKSELLRGRLLLLVSWGGNGSGVPVKNGLVLAGEGQKIAESALDTEVHRVLLS